MHSDNRNQHSQHQKHAGQDVEDTRALPDSGTGDRGQADRVQQQGGQKQAGDVTKNGHQSKIAGSFAALLLLTLLSSPSAIASL